MTSIMANPVQTVMMCMQVWIYAVYTGFFPGVSELQIVYFQNRGEADLG